MKVLLTAGAAASLALAGYIVIKLSTGPDSDWAVGLFTAAPALALAAGLAFLARADTRRH